MKILNYVVTSNHIDLLVIDSSPNVIPKSLQLIAGRTAQKFNQRKKRKGAFWEDRYNATAVEQYGHLFRCLVYMDLNMVRAGMVSHPSEWEMCGLNEIQNPPKRYGVIDVPCLQNLCGFSDFEHFTAQYRQWVQEAIASGENLREVYWTESIAVGGNGFVEEIKVKLGIKGKGRRIEQQTAYRFVLREVTERYNSVFKQGNGRLRSDKSYFWDILTTDSTS